jgi:carbonic anhydrase/acetyltransferase-like protein (isoleucine patch superfamily)
MRNLTDSEVLTLQAAGCSAESWQSVYIAENLDVSNIEHCRFEGRVEIEEGVTLRGSTIGNYHICQGAKVIDTLRLETRHSSTFGNGVKVAAVNENGGRSVAIYNNLTAQVAYIVAMYRHRKVVVEGILNQIDDFAATVRSDMGLVGRNSTILGARFIREVNIGEGVTIEGASLLENGTLLTGAYVGVDVKAKDFIAAEISKIDLGATINRCFVGENVVISNDFTAVDTDALRERIVAHGGIVDRAKIVEVH